jgi:hypothetical protein
VNSARNPAFQQLDIRIDKRCVFNRFVLDAPEADAQEWTGEPASEDWLN